MSTGEFSVYQFLEGDIQECVRDHVAPEEAMNAAAHYCNNVAAKIGLTKRVIITDGGDCTCFEWLQGKGVVYPPKSNKKRPAIDTRIKSQDHN